MSQQYPQDQVSPGSTPPKPPKKPFYTSGWFTAAAIVVALIIVAVGSSMDSSGDAAPDAATSSAPPTTAPATQPSASPTPAAKAPVKPSVKAPAASKPVTVTVTQVVDGDTIKVSTGQTVRLIGVDTPERGQCGYDLARKHLGILIAKDPVRLIAVPNRDDKDRYGRLLRYVIIPSLADEDTGLNQIASGLGIARYDGRDGYGTHPRQAAYIAADAKTPAYGCSKPTVKPSPKPTVKPTVKPSPKPTQEPTTELFFANCSEARASGVPLPLTPGDPGWNPKLDRDKDGKACE